MKNTNKKGFGLIGLILSITAVALFVLLLIWLFRNYSPNMKPFYNNVFRENVSYMQNAAKSYFTIDKLPEEVGKSSRLTLKQMEEMKLVIPFVDKDGKACDKEKSYADITKEESGYSLKVNLTCGKESDYLIEILGCHDYCNNCNAKKDETAIEYEFTREVSKDVSVLSCPSGYTRTDKICTKKTGSETINATKHYTEEKTEVSDVLYTQGQSQTIEVATVRTTTSQTDRVYADPTVNTTTTKSYTDTQVNTTTSKKYTDVIVNTTTTTEYTDPTRQVTQDCKDVRVKDPNCTVQCKWVVGSNGIPQEICNTCGYVIHRECTDVTAYICPNNYTKQGTGASTTCYRNITTTTYSCPNGYTKEGTGANTKCYKNVTTTTYSCPSGYTKEGTGSNTKCYKNITTTAYSCPNGYVKQGTGSNTKCYKDVTITTIKYSCPSDSTSNNGKTGEYLKCYKTVSGERTPYCSNPDAKIQNNKCVLVIPSKFSHYSCPNNYTLNSKNGTCKKDIFDTVKATETKKQEKSTETKWSRSKTLEGWKATGRTRTVKVK